MIIGEKGVKMDTTNVGSNYVMADAEAREGRPKHFWDLPIFIAALFGDFFKNCHTIK